MENQLTISLFSKNKFQANAITRKSKVKPIKYTCIYKYENI